jgi:hypothetical protein
MKGCRFTQLPFSFGTLFSQYVTTVRLVTFKTARAGAFKTLGGTTVGFYLWHLFSPIFININITSLDSF